MITFKNAPLILLLIIVVSRSHALSDADWVVSSQGTPQATGTIDDPLDLVTALSSSGPVKPGDIVVLKEGTYSGRFESTVSGSQELPIVIKAEYGKRVTIDGRMGSGEQTLYIRGAWVVFSGLEITNSSSSRTDMVEGVRFDAPNSKLVNSVIHNNSQGIGFWQPAVNSELYGNVIFNNGLQGETRGHGHGVYTQNQTGVKQIRNNILFFGYGFGIHAYTEGGHIEGFNFERNVWFRTGASVAGSSTLGESDGLLIGGLQPVDRVVIRGNYSWVPVANARSVRFGWGGSIENEFIEIRDNYFTGNAVTQGIWKDAIAENNHFYGAQIGPQPQDFPDNHFSNELPTYSKVVLQHNSHDTNRIDIVIYNWENNDSVLVNLGGSVLNKKTYRVHSVFDLWGEPVVHGTFTGDDIKIPMGTKKPPQPNGVSDAIVGDDDPGKRFGVFIMRLSEDASGTDITKLSKKGIELLPSIKQSGNRQLRICFPSDLRSRQAALEIYSLTGQSVASQSFENIIEKSSIEHTINPKAVSGTYIVSLKIGKKVYTERIVIQR